MEDIANITSLGIVCTYTYIMQSTLACKFNSSSRYGGEYPTSVYSVQMRSIIYVRFPLDIMLTCIVPTNYMTIVSGSHSRSVIKVEGLERMDDTPKRH